MAFLTANIVELMFSPKWIISWTQGFISDRSMAINVNDEVEPYF
jgi:hypothetical protein